MEETKQKIIYIVSLENSGDGSGNWTGNNRPVFTIIKKN